MFKPLYEEKDFISALGKLTLSVNENSPPVFKSNTMWSEQNGLVVIKTFLNDLEVLKKSSELFMQVELPNVYYTYRMDTAFLIDNVFEQIERFK